MTGGPPARPVGARCLRPAGRRGTGRTPADRFSLFLSGGSTAEACYRRLAAGGGPGERGRLGRGRRLPGRRAVRPSRRRGLQPPMVGRDPARRVGPVGSDHPMYRSGTPSAAAADYQAVIAPLPAFDLVHLGLGPDGHTASLFPGLGRPGHRRLRRPGRGQPGLPSANNPHDRITLTYPAIARARLAVFTVSGASKREAWPAWWAGADLPATRVVADRIVWLVDEDAVGDTLASGLDGTWSHGQDSSGKVSPMPADPGSPPVHPSTRHPRSTESAIPVGRLRGRAHRPAARGTAGAGRAGPSGRPRQPDDLLAQGVHPPDHAVPRPLRLLHLRQGAGPGVARPTSTSTRCSTSPGPVGPPAATRPSSPWARDPRTATRPPGSWLDDHGYASTVDYLAAACRAVVEETGLLPHANAGALDLDDLTATA